MKQFLKNRALAFVCAFSILISLCVVPVSANEWYADPGSVGEWDAKFVNVSSVVSTTFMEAWCAYKGLEVSIDPQEVLWSLFNTAISRYGSVTLGELEQICASYNSFFNQPIEPGLFSFNEYMSNLSGKAIAGLLGLRDINFEVQEHPASGLYRIKETTTGIWVVNSSGLYPYTEIISEGQTEAGDQWIGEVTAQDRVISETVAIHTLDRINLMCNRLKNEGLSVKLKTLNDAEGKPKYQGIWYNRQFYADPNGNPYVAPYNPNEWASNTERPDTTVKDEDGNEIEGLPEENTSGIDLENMLIYLPNGSIGVIDNLIYDESTKTYNIDSHDTYNTTNNYYYHWEYHINYTSITYIGQTEEYNKYYEVYYELPDGRDSADLTKEDLEQLNLSVDVIPYGRSADDTSLRSLYHFDGDTKDSSYWNYCTAFTWNKGASLTYMDAAVFDGALYLDETEHDFSLTLPSNITSGGFTLQFRYYQSHTAAPQTDSYINFGSTTVMQFNGGFFLNAAGDTLASTPVGSWNEVALIFDNGTLYYYLNGVCIGSQSGLVPNGKTITFHFGSEQQTYKYFDELRVLNYALKTGGAYYEPTSVPHDTNLSLVLPGSAVPVADEYWSITSSGENMVDLDLISGVLPDSIVTGKKDDANNWHGDFPDWTYNTNYTSLSAFDNCVRINNLSDSSSVLVSRLAQKGFLLYFGMSSASTHPFEAGDYCFSIVLADGTVCTVPVQVLFNGASEHRYWTETFDWGQMGVVAAKTSSDKNRSGWWAFILPNPNSYVDVAYIEFIPGTSTDLQAEWVTTVTEMTDEQFKTPTLAVRTDLDITSYQIGGVRPSIPEKGQVWAMVENERIVSIQIYNGQAWESCDGRIWTGSRWIPASSYNIITLQDMYDIVDATPNYEYIYSESGFWSWWQKSWNAFTEKLFAALASGGTGSPGSSGGAGSSEMGNVDLDAEDPVSDPDQEDSKSLWQFIVLVVSGGKSVISGTRELFSGAVSSVPESMGDIVSTFDSGGLAVGLLDGSYLDPDAADLPQDDPGETAAEVEEVDPWRYR